MERVEAGEDETAKSWLSKGCGCHAAEHRPPPEGAGKPWRILNWEQHDQVLVLKKISF